MPKKKNQSFVQMEEKKNQDNNENIINPLKQYEYIEPKKRGFAKQLILIIAIIICIILIVTLLKLIDNHNSKLTTNDTTNTTKPDNSEINLLTTTTTRTTKVEDEITSTLTCSSTSIENNLQIDTQVIANFHNNKLRSDINNLTIKLLDEASKEQFDNYVTVLKMFTLYLTENGNYNITDYTKDNQFSISIKTDYKNNEKVESNLTYDEDYESVKQKLTELGHTCK